MNTRRALLLAVTLPLACTKAATLTADTALSPGDTTYDGADLIVSNCTLTVNGPHSFASLRLQDGAVLTHSPAPGGELDHRLDLTVAGNLVVDATSRIDASARGFAPLGGPGAGLYDYYYPSGGGHGGPGGNGYGVAGGGSYGGVLAPASWGSGGGNMSGNALLGGQAAGASGSMSLAVSRWMAS